MGTAGAGACECGAPGMAPEGPSVHSTVTEPCCLPTPEPGVKDSEMGHISVPGEPALWRRLRAKFRGSPATQQLGCVTLGTRVNPFAAASLQPYRRITSQGHLQHSTALVSSLWTPWLRLSLQGQFGLAACRTLWTLPACSTLAPRGRATEGEAEAGRCHVQGHTSGK